MEVMQTGQLKHPVAQLIICDLSKIKESKSRDKSGECRENTVTPKVDQPKAIIAHQVR